MLPKSTANLIFYVTHRRDDAISERCSLKMLLLSHQFV